MVSFTEERRRRYGGFVIATETVRVAENLPSPRTGRKLNNYCGNGFRPEIAMFWMWYGKAKS
jgi:hypothetical protein